MVVLERYLWKGSLQATSSGFRLRARDAVAGAQGKGRHWGPVQPSGVGESPGSPEGDQPPFA